VRSTANPAAGLAAGFALAVLIGLGGLVLTSRLRPRTVTAASLAMASAPPPSETVGTPAVDFGRSRGCAPCRAPDQEGPDTVSAEELRAKIREVPDFPKPGILFYDITTLLKDADAYKDAIDLMLAPYKGEGIDVVVGMESRGFIFSAPLAYLLGAGLVPVRKLGKLPAETITVEYALEYGSNTLEIHRDAIAPGQKVLIVDDLLATGGTVHGTIELVERLKGEVVGLGFLVELEFLKGRDRLEGRRVTSVIKY
jgi:adenine phosphoribosyltransferase